MTIDEIFHKIETKGEDYTQYDLRVDLEQLTGIEPSVLHGIVAVVSAHKKQEMMRSAKKQVESMLFWMEIN